MLSYFVETDSQDKTEKEQIDQFIGLEPEMPTQKQTTKPVTWTLKPDGVIQYIDMNL